MKYLLAFIFLFQLNIFAANAQSYKYHTVKKGETVYSISKSYSIEVDEIYKYNPDAKEGIQINEKLVIPISDSTQDAVESITSSNSSETEFVNHQVKKKETLYSLSKQYNVSIDDIKRYNKQLYSAQLKMGETIRIPTGNTAVASQPDVTENKVVVENTKTEAPAQITNPKPVQQNGKREHIVLPKETKYGIARKYGMTVKELDEMNPKVEVLQPGMMIRVATSVLKDEPVIILDDRFKFYEVQPQETLFSLSRRFGVSQDSLKDLNPALQDGLKYGMVLKVPVKENTGDLADSDNPEMTEAGQFVDLKSFAKNRATKNLVLMLPYHLNLVDANSVNTYKDAIYAERVLRISLDFHSGVEMALEEARKMGISTNLKIYDTRQDPGVVNSIINTNNFSNVDAVIGPLVQNTVQAATSKLENQRVPVISPLSDREINGFGNFFQARPTDDKLRAAMMDYIIRNAAGKNVIIIADGKNFRVKNDLSSVIPSARFVDPVDNFVSEGKLSSALTSGKNWVILESENVNVLSSVTSALHRLSREKDITLLTTNKNNSYESDIVSNTHLGKLQMHYPSVDREVDSEISSEFIEAYEDEYGIEPNIYAVRGYDLTLDVILRLASSEDLYESVEKYPGYTEYFESKFHYYPKGTNGFANDAVYILKLDENLNISEVNDK